MPIERSAGAIIFRETKDGREYLLLRHLDKMNMRVTNPVRGHWDFPKGHIEKGETLEETVRREVAEETGISKIGLVPGFKKTIKYFIGSKSGRIVKFVYFFLADTKEKRVTISGEHQGFVWLEYREAYDRITYPNSKKLLKNAEEFIQTKGI